MITYQIARVNCRRCHELAQAEGDINRCNSLWEARNMAMNSLKSGIDENIGEKESMQLNVAAVQALDSCVDCDFKTARIDEIFDPDEWGA